MQAARDDLIADRVGRITESLARNRRLVVPSSSMQEVDAIDADTNFGMAAEVN
jgi:hypothetical protein